MVKNVQVKWTLAECILKKSVHLSDLLLRDCISNWLRDCLLQGVTMGFWPWSSLFDSSSINFLDDASEPTQTSAKLQDECRGQTIRFMQPKKKVEALPYSRLCFSPIMSHKDNSKLTPLTGHWLCFQRTWSPAHLWCLLTGWLLSGPHLSSTA